MILQCERCENDIDSDKDVECSINDGDVIACERCRERMVREGALNPETNTMIEVRT